MRRINSLLVAAGLAIAVSGCDDFLAPEPATFASSETYFKTPDQMEQAVSGLYAEMRGLFGGNLRLLNDLRGEDVTLQFNINVPGFTFQIDEFSEATNDGTVAVAANSSLSLKEFYNRSTATTAANCPTVSTSQAVRPPSVELGVGRDARRERTAKGLDTERIEGARIRDRQFEVERIVGRTVAGAAPRRPAAWLRRRGGR